MSEISPRELAAFREMGRRSALSDMRSRQDASFRRDRMVVKAVHGGTVDVDGGSSAIPMRLNGVPMTTACAGVRVGDVVVVDTYMHKPLAIGVLAR